MPGIKILVVEDDPPIRNLLLRFLTRQNYQVESAGDGKSGLEIFDKFHPDLVILDVNLPDMLGYDLCEKMQSRTNVFILMLTSRTGAEDKKQGFLKGADDYLTKPFNLEELELRIQAILKRRRSSSPEGNQLLVYGNLVIDTLGQQVTVNNQVIPLTVLEFKLLFCLASQPRKVWTRSELLQNIWGYQYLGEDRVVDVHISLLRRKIDLDTTQPSFIQTARGIGYRFYFKNKDLKTKKP